ncbi:MAG: MFS transporter [Sphingobium sp.]
MHGRASGPADEGRDAGGELPGLAYRGYVLLLLMLIAAVAAVDRQILFVLVEPIRHEFGLNDKQIGALTGIAFALTYVVVSIPVARLSDRAPRKIVIGVAVSIWSVMTALTGFAQSFFQLFITRVGVGFGEAGAAAPSQALIGDMFPPRQRATAMSLYLMGAPLGMAVGLGMGGWVAQHYGWRWALVAAGVPGIILGPLMLFTVRNITKGAADGITRTFTPPGIGETLRMVARIRTLPFLFGGATLQSLLASGLVGWMPAFLQRTHGLSPVTIGASLGAAMGAGSLIGHLLGGPLSDWLIRRDLRWPLWLGAGIVLVSGLLSLLAFAGPASIFFPAIALQILVSGLFTSPLLSLVVSLPPVWARATTVAVMYTVLQLVGLGIGPTAVGALSDALRPAYGEGSLQMAMLLSLLLAFPAALLLLLAARHYRADHAAAAERLAGESAPHN